QQNQLHSQRAAKRLDAGIAHWFQLCREFLLQGCESSQQVFWPSSEPPGSLGFQGEHGLFIKKGG
ncbi:MAG: hypothetical protein ACPHK8_01825, partial [Thermoplasmatota archaeon]